MESRVDESALRLTSRSPTRPMVAHGSTRPAALRSCPSRLREPGRPLHGREAPLKCLDAFAEAKVAILEAFENLDDPGHKGSRIGYMGEDGLVVGELGGVDE